MQGVVSAEEIFKEFREHSISEFFRKNSQMLGYSGKARSLTTVVNEYTSNSLDACEEAGILPDIRIEIKELEEDKYVIIVKDNGPGIPKKHVGKALATILAGTKFHRYLQQRGQQGIGAAGCTLFSRITTGKPIHVASSTGKESYECDITINIQSNKPLVTNTVDIKDGIKGTRITGEFADVKYENGEHGAYEYLKRTALSNPHVNITLIEPESKREIVFIRSVNEMPKRPKMIKPHPLGITTNDIIDFAQRSESRRLSSFLIDTFSRTTSNRIQELKDVAKDIDFNADPRSLTWIDAEKLVKTFRQLKWVAPDLDSLSTIGEKQVEVAIKNILNPKFLSVVERRPKVFKGGIPFVVEAGIAYGGGAGKGAKEKTGAQETAEGGNQNEFSGEGNVLRFANKVPLLFDASNCAITEAVKGIDWKRYGIGNFDEEPISVLVNVSSVYVPYAGIGKQAIAKEDEIVEEIKLAVMDCARTVQKYISGMRSSALQETRYKTIMRYVTQLSKDLSDITGVGEKEIEGSLKALIEKRYKKLFEEKRAEEPIEEKVKSVEEQKE